MSKRRPRFEVRRSLVDGMYRRWEQIRLSKLRPLEDGEIDGPVWVVTGVFKTRKEIFA